MSRRSSRARRHRPRPTARTSTTAWTASSSCRRASWPASPRCISRKSAGAGSATWRRSFPRCARCCCANAAAARAGRETVRAIIERQSFGERERLVAQTLLQVAHVGADVFHITPKQLSRLGDAIASWEWEPASFALTIRTTTGEEKRFEYEERRTGAGDPEKGLEEFLRDPQLSGSATPGELAFLKSLRFKDRRPSALYYYRELQNLRDPLHFRPRP